MAVVKTITKHSTKKYGNKKTKKKKVVKSKKVVAYKPGMFVNKNKIYLSHKNKLVYTYILKDIEKGIYKIGKTADPHSRFKSLCSRGKVMPIALVNKDVEKELHKAYADNRVVHEEFYMNGGTEWFQRGGKFDTFIDSIDKGNFLPYITLHMMTKGLIEDNCIRLNDSVVEWELSQSTFGYYMIGLELLKMLGYVRYVGETIKADNRADVLIIGKRISVSDKVYDNLKDNYKIYLSHKAKEGIILENRNKESRLRRVVIEAADFDGELLLLLNSV